MYFFTLTNLHTQDYVIGLVAELFIGNILRIQIHFSFFCIFNQLDQIQDAADVIQKLQLISQELPQDQ